MATNVFPFLRVSHDAQMDLCTRVREMRLQANVTQAVLAKSVGVSIGTLKRFESMGEIQLSAFIRIAEYFSRLGEIDHLMLPSDVPQSLFNYQEPRKRQRARSAK